MTDLKNGPLFPEVKMNLVRKSAPVQAIVVSNELCTAGKSASFVKHLVLDIRGTLLEGQFAVGQSFGVVAPGTDKHGRPHKLRLYSLTIFALTLLSRNLAFWYSRRFPCLNIFSSC